MHRLDMVAITLAPSKTSQGPGDKYEIFSFNNLSYSYMREEHMDDVFYLLVKGFQENNPLVRAHWQKKPEAKQLQQKMQSMYWNISIQELARNNLSLVIQDRTKNNEVVGVGAALDHSFVPDPYKIFGKDAQYMNLEQALYDSIAVKLPQKVRELLRGGERGKVLEFHGAAFKKEYLGKGLQKLLVRWLFELGKRQKFQYAFIFLTSGKERPLFQQFNMEVLAQADAKQFIWKGDLPFELIDERSRYPCIMWQSMAKIRLQ